MLRSKIENQKSKMCYFPVLGLIKIQDSRLRTLGSRLVTIFLLASCVLSLASCLTFAPPSERRDDMPEDGIASSIQHPVSSIQHPASGVTRCLLSDRVSSITIGPRYVWVGTDRGLNRYDKQRRNWDSFTVRDGLIHNSVLSIALDGDLVWVGTSDGASCYNAKAGTWTDYTPRNDLSGRQVSCIAVDSRYTWFGTEKGISRYDKEMDSWAQKNKEDGLANDAVTRILVEDDYIWISTKGGVSRYDKRTESWNNYSKKDGLVDDNISATAVDADQIWFGTESKGLSLYDKRNSEFVRTFTKRDQLASDHIRSLMVDGTSLWLGTADNGLQRYILAVRTWRHYTRDDGLPSEHITSIAADENLVWIGTHEHGLACYDMRGETWTSYRESRALSDNQVNEILATDEAVWIATSSGLSKFSVASEANASDWQTLTRADGLADGYITCVAEEGGRLWVGTPRGLGKRENGEWTFYTARAGLPDDFVTCIACGKNKLWIGTKRGPATLSLTDSSIQYPASSIEYPVSCIALDGDLVWLATSHGLIYHDSSTGESIYLTEADGLPAKAVNTVKVSDRYVWAGTTGGLARLNRGQMPSKIECYTTERGLPNNNVRAIAIDSDGIWAGTPAGLAKYNVEEDEWISYDHENTVGKLHDNITSISIESGGDSSTDRVWVGTPAGVSCLDKGSGLWESHTSAAITETLRSSRVGRLAEDGHFIWFSNWHDSTEGAIGQLDRRTETFRFFGRHELPLKPTENPITYLRCITVDEDYVWFGTNGGLLSYQKAADTWRHYTTSDGLANNDVWNVVPDESYIWVSHIGGMVSRGVQNSQDSSRTSVPLVHILWETYEVCPIAVYSNVGSIAADSRYVWFTTTWDGVRRYDKRTDTWESFAESDGLGGNETNQVLIDGDYVWVSTWGDVSRYHTPTGKWETFSRSRVLSGVTTWMDRGLDGVWLMYSWEDAVGTKYNVKTDSWTTLKAPRTDDEQNYYYYGRSATQALETPGNVWFATGGRGLLRYNKASKDWTVFDEKNGLASNRISERALLADDNYVWVGTDRGLCRYDERKETWITFTQSASIQTFKTRKVYAIAAEWRYVWVGTPRSLQRYDKQTDRWVDHPKPSITCVAVDEKYVWAGTTRHGVRRYSKTADNWTYFSDKNGLPSTTIRDLDIEGYDLWVATDSGVCKYNRLSDDPNAWEVHTCTLDVKAAQDEKKYTRTLASNDVRCVAAGEKAVWFGTDKGASRYDKEQRTWMTFTSEDGLFGTDISAIAIDGDDVWFGTDLCATKYNEKSHDFITYTITEGLASNVVTCIAIDDREIWFGSSDSGAACMDKVAGKWRVFTTNDGMLHNRVMTIALDGDYVWFGTEAGLCRYDRKTSAWTAYADDISQ